MSLLPNRISPGMRLSPLVIAAGAFLSLPLLAWFEPRNFIKKYKLGLLLLVLVLQEASNFKSEAVAARFVLKDPFHWLRLRP